MGAAEATLKMLLIGEDRSASKALKGVGDQADRQASKMSKLGGVLKGAAKVGLLGVGVAAVGASKALFDMAKGAAEDHSAQLRLATALKNSTGATKTQVGAVEDWITKQGQLFGVTDDELRPALGKLAAATHDIGKAQKLTSLAMDISAGSGKSLSQVTTALAKAQNGQVSGLTRLGISVKDAHGKTVDFATAQKRLADTFKGQASVQANTYEGRMKRLHTALSETGESIGYLLLPILTKLAGWFVDKGLPALQKFGNWLGQHIPPIINAVRAVIAKFVGDGSGKLSKFAADMKAIFASAVSVVSALWHSFGANIIGYLGKSLKNVITILSGAFKVIKGIFEVFDGILHGNWKKVWQGIKDILRGAATVLKGVVRQLWNGITFAFKNAGVILRGIFKGLWSGITSLARTGVSAVVGLIKNIPQMLINLGGSFLNAGKSLIGKFFSGLKALGGIAAHVAGNIWNAIIAPINSGITSINNAIPNSLSWHGIGFDLPDNPIPTIPALAKGGVVSRPTVALIGEAGPEAVVPLSRMGGMGGGDVVININGALDPIAVGKQVQKALLAVKRHNGGKALGLT